MATSRSSCVAMLDRLKPRPKRVPSLPGASVNSSAFTSSPVLLTKQKKSCDIGRAVRRVLDLASFSDSATAFPGLATRGALLEAAEKNIPDSEKHLEQYKSVQVTMAFVLLLSICSELEQCFKFGLRNRLLIMWRMSEELPI